jgi:hypothetical protein
MKKQRVIELAVKVIVAALTAFLKAISTTLYGSRTVLVIGKAKRTVFKQ